MRVYCEESKWSQSKATVAIATRRVLFDHDSCARVAWVLRGYCVGVTGRARPETAVRPVRQLVQTRVQLSY